MKFLSELYNVTLKRGIRGKAKSGFVRPTIGQNFMTHRDFQEIEKPISNVDLSQYTRVVYVDANNGNDLTGDGSKFNSYASVKVGIENATDGEAVFIKKGTYQLQGIGNGYGISYDKNVDIIGEDGKEVVLIWNGLESGATSRDWPLFGVRNNNSLLTNFTIQFYPKPVGATYSRAIWRASYGTYKNLFIEVLGTHAASHSYWNSGPANTPTVENCTFYHSLGTYSGDYSGSPLYRNCLSNVNWDHGTKQYCVPNKAYDKVQYLDSIVYTENDVDLANKGTGTNPDGSQAHIGVYGGEFAWA